MLEGMVEHVVYEVEMLHSTLELIETGRYPTAGGGEARVLGNALLESMLIHARSLDEFFWADDRRDDDVIAIDYLPSWPRRTVLSQTQRQRVNKKVAHLTTVRSAGPDPWPLYASHAILAAFAEFVDRLASDQPSRAAWFGRWVQRR